MIKKIEDICEKSKKTTLSIRTANAFELGTEFNHVLTIMVDKFNREFKLKGGYKKKLRYTRRKRKYKKKTNKFFKR